jgi:hypothetical protein
LNQKIGENADLKGCKAGLLPALKGMSSDQKTGESADLKRCKAGLLPALEYVRSDQKTGISRFKGMQSRLAASRFEKRLSLTSSCGRALLGQVEGSEASCRFATIRLVIHFAVSATGPSTKPRAPLFLAGLKEDASPLML